jgi:hypothetical protein
VQVFFRVDTGYHSHYIQPIAKPNLDLMRNDMPDDDAGDYDEPDYDTPNVFFSSPVTGGRITSMRQVAAPEHWVDSLTQPVEFVQAFTDMVIGGTDQSGNGSINVDVLLEMGPIQHSLLRFGSFCLSLSLRVSIYHTMVAWFAKNMLGTACGQPLSICLGVLG